MSYERLRAWKRVGTSAREIRAATHDWGRCCTFLSSRLLSCGKARGQHTRTHESEARLEIQVQGRVQGAMASATSSCC